MVDKGISPSHSRIGWLYDGDSQTPDIAVMLQNTGDQIVLSVPYNGVTGFEAIGEQSGKILNSALDE